MQTSDDDTQQTLKTVYSLLGRIDREMPVSGVLIRTLEALIQHSGSRFAFLLHNDSGTLISEFAACNPRTPYDNEYLQQHASELSACLLPQMRRIYPLIANSSTRVKKELDNGNAWRLLQRTLLLPLHSVTGDKKGILTLFGKPDNYTNKDIIRLEPLISLCLNLLIIDEQQPDNQSKNLHSPASAAEQETLHENHYQFAHSKDPKFITTADGLILHHNSAADTLLAFPSEELIDQPIERLIPKLKLNLHPTESDNRQELKAFSKSGKLIAVRVSCSPFIQHEELLFSITVQDIRKEVETQTEHHERVFRIQKQQRATLEVARIATQEDAPFHQLVQEICHIAAETLRAPRAGIWLAEDNTSVYRNVIQTDRSGANYCESQPLLLETDATFVRQLEQVRVLALTNLNTPSPNISFLPEEYIQRNQVATLICAAFIKEGRLIGFFILEDTHRSIWQEDQYNFVREITNYLHILVLNEHRYKIQKDLEKQEQQFRLLFFDSPLAMMAFDRYSHEFIAVNHTATQVFGYSLEEMHRRGIYDLIPTEQVMNIHQLVASTRPANLNYQVLESKMQKYNGDSVDVEIHAHSISLSSRDAILMVVHDITEKKRIESSLRRTQKMEAIGQLVGGIAHDFNNITNIIKGHAELLEMRLGSDEKATKYIGAIQKAADRTTSLTHKLMQFSRQQQINSQVCNVREIIHDLLELMTKSLTRNIQIVLELEHTVWPTLLDKGDFEDMMINLAINARDAMQGHGILNIGCRNVQLSADDPLMVRDREPGDYVRLHIKDTGSGIPKELQEKIFDPFFTTKEKGKGTGLGLSMVYGFVKRSHGFLEIKSQEGEGTTFYIWLPRTTVTSAPTPLQNTDNEPPPLQVTQGHQALVVDDEADIRASLSEMLAHQGFEVLQAENVAHAQQVLQEQKTVSLVISDIVMPGSQNGVNLAQWIRQYYPATHIILASGYADNISLAEARNASCPLLKKPFGRKELMQLLHQWDWT